MLYLWVALYAFYCFSRPAAVLHVVVIGISYAVPIALAPPPFSPVAHWATTVMTIALAGWFVGVLKGRLDESLGRLELLAGTDALTGLANRRGWTTRAGGEINRASRSGDPPAVAVIDLDNFKAFKDEHGHARPRAVAGGADHPRHARGRRYRPLRRQASPRPAHRRARSPWGGTSDDDHLTQRAATPSARRASRAPPCARAAPAPDREGRGRGSSA